MTPVGFDQAIEYLFKNENTVYTNNPRDSGGPTKYGVTLRAYASYVGRAVTAEEIQNLSEDDAKKFYFARYWAPLACPRIVHTSVAIALFDTGVLYGVGTSALLAQEALSACGVPLKFDGHIGDKTVAAFNRVNDDEFLEAFHELILQRIEHVVAINPKNLDFRDGWKNRANRLLTLSSAPPSNKEVT